MDKAAVISKALAARKKKSAPNAYKEKPESGQTAYAGGKPQKTAGAVFWKKG